MGSICSSCTLFDDSDFRDRRHDVECKQLISNPDPTSSLPATPLQNADLLDADYNSPRSKKKSSVSERLAKLESNNKATKSKKKSKTNNAKPKKKWIVKGIDDKTTKKPKKPINAYNIQQNIVDGVDAEPSVSLSHTDRMKLYQTDLVNVEQKEKERMQQHKQSRGGYGGIQVSSQQKEMAKQLLEQRVETQKKGNVRGIQLNIDMQGGIALKSDDIQPDSAKGARQTKTKKRTLNELLKEATSEDARNITLGMGLIQSEYDNKEKRDICTLNMNNNNMLSRLTDEQKMKFIYLIGHSIIDRSGCDKIERVKMCNTGIGGTLMVELMRILVENRDTLILTELWLESNRIGDGGMHGLCELIECDLESLKCIKLYNNKKVVSTGMCNKMIDSLEKNSKIIKFTFEWRLQQQRDRVERLLKKNQESRRKSRRLNK